MYGPVRTVVWEGRGREAPPYPDQSHRFTKCGKRSKPLGAKRERVPGGVSGSIWPLRLGFGRILVRDPIHDAVSEGDAIDGLGKTPIIDQVGKPCLTQTARQYVVEILD